MKNKKQNDVCLVSDQYFCYYACKFLQTGHTQVASLGGFFYKASENTLIGLLNFLEGNIVKVKALWGITQLLFTKTYPGQEMSIFRRIVLH